MTSDWNQLTAKYKLGTDSPLAAISKFLEQPSINAQLNQADTDRRYPKEILKDLHRLGISKLLANPVGDPYGENESAPLSIWHAVDLVQRLAQINGTLVITVGVNYLALLPALIAGTKEQLSWLFSKVHHGNYAAMLLSEAAHGSNLRQNQTVAFQRGDHYCLTGEKALINGGGQHELLMVLARLNEGVFNFFMVERNQSITSPKRWLTLPMPGADISSIHLDQVSVPASKRLGPVGSGFTLLQKAFTFTRGGIAGMNAGASQRAVTLASKYAQSRQLYGQPILHLGAIADHLLKMKAMHQLLIATTCKATVLLNTYGAAAAYHASVAKVGTSQLAEQIVHEGRLLHGARGLLMELPYHQLVRDVTLYGTFDGTTHIVLAQIEARLVQLVQMSSSQPKDLLEMVQQAYQRTPTNLVQVAKQRHRPLLISIPDHITALEDVVIDIDLSPLATLARALWGMVAHSQHIGLWATDQGWRFAVAQQAINLEMLIALVETGDSGCQRVLLGQEMSDCREGQKSIFEYAFGWFGCQIASAVRQLAYQSQYELSVNLDLVEQKLSEISHQARREIQQNLEVLT